MAKIALAAQSAVDNTVANGHVNDTSTDGDVEITVEAGIPVPATTQRKAKYPWGSMSKGDSFFIPGAKVETFYTLCSTASKTHKCKFIARKWDGEGGVKGVRVWRSE